MVDGGLLQAGKYPAVTQERYEMIDKEEKNKGGGTRPSSNHSFKVNSK